MATSNLAISEFTSSAFVVYALRKLQAASWFPWLKHEAERARLAWSAFAAALAAVGISWQWSVNPDGSHNLLIQNLTLMVVLLALWKWAGHFALQETINSLANRWPQYDKFLQDLETRIDAAVDKKLGGK